MNIFRYSTLLLFSTVAFACAAEEEDLYASEVTLRPTKSGCSDCTLTTTTIDPDAAIVSINVVGAFAGYVIKAVEVDVYDSGGVEHVYEITRADVLAGATGAGEYEVPFSLGGVDPVRAAIEMRFFDPVKAKRVDTRDHLSVLP